MLVLWCLYYLYSLRCCRPFSQIQGFSNDVCEFTVTTSLTIDCHWYSILWVRPVLITDKTEAPVCLERNTLLERRMAQCCAESQGWPAARCCAGSQGWPAARCCTDSQGWPTARCCADNLQHGVVLTARADLQHGVALTTYSTVLRWQPELTYSMVLRWQPELTCRLLYIISKHQQPYRSTFSTAE